MLLLHRFLVLKASSKMLLQPIWKMDETGFKKGKIYDFENWESAKWV